MTREKGGRGVEVEGQVCGLCHRKQGTLRGAGTGQPVADMAGVLLTAKVAAGFGHASRRGRQTSGPSLSQSHGPGVLTEEPVTGNR